MKKKGDFPDGAVFEVFADCEEGVRPNVSATILPPPTVSSVGPVGGSITGGTSVVIGGSNFAEVKGVSFGSTPASAFSVNSEGQITAVAPPSATLAKVNVSVTTIAGAATSASQFAYEGCTVPKLTGKKLKASRKKATKADCKIGKVKHKQAAKPKTGKVLKQKPKAGTLLPPGGAIKVTVGA